MRESRGPLRVALLAGTLGRGGSEKQILHTACILRDAGVCVHVYSLTQGEYYEALLADESIRVIWCGPQRNPLVRLGRLSRMMRRFGPHVVQSMHAFMNAYAWPTARVVGALSIGALRSDLQFCIDSYGPGAGWLLRGPDVLVANSHNAAREAVESGMVEESCVYVLPNCIDTTPYRTTECIEHVRNEAVFLARLLPSKRVDLFLKALSVARERVPSLRGTVLGDGPELGQMRHLASDLGLMPDGVRFLGHCVDPIPRLLGSRMLVFCSDSEGSPNVLLEALAANLPVITTPAGDAEEIVRLSNSGYVVPFGDAKCIAEKMVDLARSDELSRTLGSAGRAFVESAHSSRIVGNRLFAIYRAAASKKRYDHVLRALAALEPPRFAISVSTGAKILPSIRPL